MAIVYPLANGNWSTVANWYSGGSAYGQLPLATDDVYADGKTVVIDQDITVNLLTNLQRSGGTLGGTFNCTTARTINAVSISANTGCLSLTCTGITQNIIATNILGCTGAAVVSTINITGTSGVVNITATNISQNAYQATTCITNGVGNTLNVTANISNTNYSAIINSTGILNFYGNVQCTNIGSYNSINQNGAGGITNITGSIIGGANVSGYGIYAGLGTVNILSNQTMSGTAGVGVYYCQGSVNFGTIANPINIYGAPSSATSGFLLCTHLQGGNVTIYGNIIMQNYSYSSTLGIIRFATTGTMTINGNITGGTVANTIALNIESTGTVIVNGNVTGGSNATNTPAIYITQAGTIQVSGAVTSNSYPAIFSTVTTAKFNLLGDVVNVGSLLAYYGSLNVKISPTNAQQFTFQDANNVNRILATSNITAGAPLPANVRYGTVYGSLSQYTGTCYVPNPSNVSKGVPVDNTVGTADLTAQDMWNALTSGITTIGSIGKLLKDNVDTTISSRATQTSVNNTPANTINELETSTQPIAERLRVSSTVNSTGNQIAAF